MHPHRNYRPEPAPRRVTVIITAIAAIITTTAFTVACIEQLTR